MNCEWYKFLNICSLEAEITERNSLLALLDILQFVY